MSPGTVSDQPLVSVIVPSHNHRQYVGQCLASIAAQTYAAKEVIVIDDGSSDGSDTYLRQLCDDYGFHFERQQNQGLAKTLNRAIALARGKYIAPIGSDDIWMLDKLDKQVRFLEARPDVAVCGGNSLKIDDAGHIIDRRQKFPPYRELGFDEVFTASVPGIDASGAMIRMSVLEEAGPYDPDIPLEDVYLWLKLTARGHRIAGLNDVLIYYRKHSSNTYKNIGFMSDQLLKTYAPYREHPCYPLVVNRMLVSHFLAAAKRDKPCAVRLLRKISPRHYGWKVLRGVLHLLFNFGHAR